MTLEALGFGFAAVAAIVVIGFVITALIRVLK